MYFENENEHRYEFPDFPFYVYIFQILATVQPNGAHFWLIHKS